jgi:hypothetical protein
MIFFIRIYGDQTLHQPFFVELGDPDLVVLPPIRNPKTLSIFDVAAREHRPDLLPVGLVGSAAVKAPADDRLGACFFDREGGMEREGVGADEVVGGRTF